MSTTPQGRPYLMQVVVRDRQGGKTTELVKWLLDGKQTANYPGWSRVIVCAHSTMVIRTARTVRDLVYNGWRFKDEQYMPHQIDNHAKVHLRLKVDVCKAVWSLDDLESGTRGNRDFDYAVDDIELLLQRFLPPYRPPAMIAVTGEVKEP